MTNSDLKQKLKHLFDTHCDALRRFAWYKVGSEALADDLVQDAFVKLWDKRHSIKWETAVGLLYKMIGNMAMDHHKHRKVELTFTSRATLSTEEPGPDFELEYSEFHKLLEHCISALPVTSREAFLMNRIDSFKYAEIADMLRISVKAVEKRMTVAIKSLTNCIGQKI